MGDTAAAAARLKERLRQEGVEITNPDFEANFDDMIRRFRGEQVAGAPPRRPVATDPFGDSLRDLKDGLDSPEAIFTLRTVSGFLFFLSTLEDVPKVGALLSVGLDLMTAAGQVLMKFVTKTFPVLFGFIPLPLMGLVGLIFVAVIGMFVWPLLAAISFSRQDFTGAMDSILRAIPPPMGEAVADAFLTVNRTAGRVLPTMGKFLQELVGNIDTILSLFKNVDAEASRRVKAGLEVLQSSFPKPLPVTIEPSSSAPPPAVVPSPPAAPPAASPPPTATPPPAAVAPPPLPSRSAAVGAGRKPLSTKPRKGPKWTKAERVLYERFSGAGLR